jgi:hypothetical protein
MKSIVRLVTAMTILLGAADVIGETAAPASPLAPLSVAEREAATNLVLHDDRVRRLVGPGTPRIVAADAVVDKAEAQKFLTGETDTPPGRHVTVLAFDPKTNRAARVVVALDENRIVSVDRADPASVPLVGDDVEDAFALAKKDRAVRRAVGDGLDQAAVSVPGREASGPLVVEGLPLRTSDPRDPCRVDRCLDLIFRAADGYLPIRVRVDVTKRSVSVEGHR